MASKEEIDSQFDEIIQQALQKVSDGVITIVKKHNQVVVVNIQEQRDPARSGEKNRHLALVDD